MDITAFIRELLFGHDCVIVPGFGGFIGNYSPARIDRSSGTFYPPVKKISFNRNLTHNDGLLVGRISGSSEMTYGDARNAVEKFVSDLRRKIEKGEKEGEAAPVDVYTLEVTPEEGERLSLASTQGRLQFALRNPMDTEVVLTSGATIPDTLASFYTPGAKKLVSPGEVKPISAPGRSSSAKQEYEVMIINGAKATVVKNSF